jgi:hypothetical protein
MTDEIKLGFLTDKTKMFSIIEYGRDKNVDVDKLSKDEQKLYASYKKSNPIIDVKSITVVFSLPDSYKNASEATKEIDALAFEFKASDIEEFALSNTEREAYFECSLRLALTTNAIVFRDSYATFTGMHTAQPIKYMFIIDYGEHGIVYFDGMRASYDKVTDQQGNLMSVNAPLKAVEFHVREDDKLVSYLNVMMLLTNYRVGVKPGKPADVKK